MKDIVDHLERWAEIKPETTLYGFLDGAGDVAESYSFRRMRDRSAEIAAHLAATGRVGYGTMLLLVYPPGPDFIAAFYACARLGAVAVPVQPPDASGVLGGLEKLAQVMRDCGALTALTSSSYLEQLERLIGRSAEAAELVAGAPLADLAWLATDKMAGPAPAAPRRSNPLLLLQYTSGSTQNPRGVMVTHDNVVANGCATLQHADPVGVSWLPHYHDMGLIGYYLYILLRGGTSYWLSGAQFMKRPLQWLEAVGRYRATITSAPNFAYEYCLREDKVPEASLAALDLSSLRIMMNAAEPVRPSTYRRFLQRFAPCGLPPASLVVYYGLAENTLAATGGGRVAITVNSGLLERNHLRIEAPRPDGYNQLEVMSCGRPMDEVVVRIVDPQTGAACTEDRIGEIWLAGPSRALGYFDKPQLNETLFAARIMDEPKAGPFFRTGDMGFLHDEELFVCGRLKDMIICGGRNYYPNDIEAVVERASDKIRPGCVAAFAIERDEAGEGIAILAEANRSNDLPDLEQIAIEIRKRCQVEIDLMAVVPHGTIAKTSSGKVARQFCRSAWQSGGIKVLARRDRVPRDSADGLLDELLNRFGVEGYEEHTLAALGVDSFTLVELSVYIEGLLERLGADSEAAESLFDLRILQAITVGELRALIAEIERTGQLPRSAPKAYKQRSRSIERDELREMQRDCELPADIAPAARAAASDGPILLTGATGFLGSHLLDALLRFTDREIVALVRAEDGKHALARTESALHRTLLLDGDMRAAFGKRVRAVPADIARPRLGLAPRDWEALSHEVGAIYHCGAEVDYVKPYRAMRGANVLGTREMLRLACAGAAKRLNLVSTTFMFGFVARETCLESDFNEEMAGLNFGYPQTKWVAEQLAFEAGRRGLPLTVFRPSLVTASRAGHYVRGDLMARILAYMIRHGVSMNTANQVSLLPVDLCADNIVALSLLSHGKTQTLHVVADSYYAMRDVCALVTEQFGYAFRYLPLPELIAHINANCTREDPLYPLVAFFNHNYRRIERMSRKRYDSRNYRKCRDAAPRALPEPPLAEIVAPIVRFLQQEGMIAPARRAPGLMPQDVTMLDLEPSS